MDASPPQAPRPPADGDPPAERRHPLRFVWQMDEAGRFTLDSDEFIALIGPRTAAAIGRPWAQMAIELGLDPEGHVARALATEETWSGLTVAWPVDHGAERLEVELSGLPIFDRDRRRRGHRGFGICRDVPRLTSLARRMRAPAAVVPTATEAASADRAMLAEEEPDARDTVVPLRAAAGEAGPALSAVEHSAFRELSRKLSQRLSAAGIAHERAQALAMPDEDEPANSDLPVPNSTDGMLRMLDRLPVGVLVYRPERLIYANPPFLRWSGHATLAALQDAGGLDALFTEPLHLAAPPEGRAVTLTVDRGGEINVEGELIDLLWEGEPAYALIAAPSTREQAQLTLAQAEVAELQTILDTATDGVVVLDRGGRISSANRSAQALFGYDAEQFSGRDFTDLFATESAATARDYLDHVARGGIASVIDGGRQDGGRQVIGRMRQGGSIALFMTMGRLGDAGKLCAIFRDITAWKKSEQDLIAAKREAERASSAKSDLLAKISHEIRTPLNAIIGFSEVMIEEGFGPIGNERYREYLKDIHASGGHLLSLINDLLDLSKIEAGKLELTFAVVSLNDIIQQCVAIMQPQANRERVIIRTSLPLSLPQLVADARSLRQIVLNLLSNSIKFTGAGGQVIVSTARNDDGEVVLRVRDTGIGMSEKELVTALEPFRQVATSAPGGCGLGLPLTKALAQANHASFHIRSTPDEGTLVEIVFPPGRVLAGLSCPGGPMPPSADPERGQPGT